VPAYAVLESLNDVRNGLGFDDGMCQWVRVPKSHPSAGHSVWDATAASSMYRRSSAAACSQWYRRPSFDGTGHGSAYHLTTTNIGPGVTLSSRSRDVGVPGVLNV